MKAILGIAAVAGTSIAGYIVGRVIDANAPKDQLNIAAPAFALFGDLVGGAVSVAAMTSKKYRPAGIAGALTALAVPFAWAAADRATAGKI